MQTTCIEGRLRWSCIRGWWHDWNLLTFRGLKKYGPCKNERILPLREGKDFVGVKLDFLLVTMAVRGVGLVTAFDPAAGCRKHRHVNRQSRPDAHEAIAPCPRPAYSLSLPIRQIALDRSWNCLPALCSLLANVPYKGKNTVPKCSRVRGNDGDSGVTILRESCPSLPRQCTRKSPFADRIVPSASEKDARESIGSTTGSEAPA